MTTDATNRVPKCTVGSIGQQLIAPKDELTQMTVTTDEQEVIAELRRNKKGGSAQNQQAKDDVPPLQPLFGR